MQLVLVASLVAMPALNIAGSIAGAAVQAAGSLGWLVSTVLIAVFVVLAHGVATGLGRPPSAPRGQLVALTLIPCVSVVGIPYALHQLAKVFAELSHDEGVVRRTTIAAVLYPVIAFGGGVAGTGILMATLPAALDREPASDLAIALAVSLPSLLAQAALAAATYFVTTAAAAAVDLKRDLPAAGAGGPAAIAV
ncbi:MAG: hypothetical protein HYS27_08295 [Deltaproteobacteria bacterium]|nr:hypothetical protein [Deltaproteobacteria bacterium]